MKKTRSLCLLFVALMLFSSCKSVYEDIPEPTKDPGETEAVEVDTSSEYYTTGSVNVIGNFKNGYYYNGSWIYPESQLETVPVRGENGTVYYEDKTIKRFVKYNPHTNTLSSACLDPACTHSPGSDCVMIINEFQTASTFPICLDRDCDHSPESDCVLNKKNDKSEISRSYLSSYAVYGDWISIVMTSIYSNYGTHKDMTLYNLKTGETRKGFSPEIGGLIMTSWDGNSYHEGKLYKVKKTFDYTNTEYDPDGDAKATDYTPETIFTLCVYDFETNKSTELFEIPNYYGLQSITNKRFYFAGLYDDYFYSCTLDGKDHRREDVRTILTGETIGTYIYQYTNKGFMLYDLTANTQTEFETEFTLYGKPVVTDNGIFYATYTTIDEVNLLAVGPGEDQTDEEWADELEKLMFSGTAQIWRSDYEGNNFEIVFEKENSQIDVMFADDKFVFVQYLTEPGALSYNMARAVINLETGEIVQIPYFDLILSPDMANS